MARLGYLFSLFCIAAALFGCAGVPTHLETPRVSFVGLHAVEAGMFEQRLQVRLRVQNPNNLELPVKGLDVDVELAGEPFAHGVSAREFTVPARGEAEFDMIVTANAATALMRIAGGEHKRGSAVEYRLKGKLSTRLGMLRSIPFEETGKVSLDDLLGKRRKTG